MVSVNVRAHAYAPLLLFNVKRKTHNYCEGGSRREIRDAVILKRRRRAESCANDALYGSLQDPHTQRTRERNYRRISR